MDDSQLGRGNESNMMKVLDKMQKSEAQKKLLETTQMNNNLLQSRILSSLQPKVGKKFIFEDLERKKLDKLKEIRKDLIEIAIEEKDRELQSLKTQLTVEKEKLKASDLNTAEQKDLLKKLEAKSDSTAKQLNKKANKKVSFHLEERAV